MFFLISFLFSHSLLWAAPNSCSPIDLTNVKIPRWSQGHTNLCYSYSAASLIDYYRLTKGDKDQTHVTSPLLLSLKTIENYQDLGSRFSGGKIEHAFQTAKSFGTCGIQKVSDHLGSASTDLILETLSQYYEEFRESPENIGLIAEKLKVFLQRSRIKNEELPEIAEVERNLLLGESMFKINTLMKYCGDAKNLNYLPTPKLLFQPDISPEEVNQQLQTNLSLNIAVGINYCANIVTEPLHQGKMKGDKWLCDENKNHSAIVVGRKTINGKCNYLVRDSGCEGYSKNPKKCKRGEYWLEENQLVKNLHGIYWLE